MDASEEMNGGVKKNEESCFRNRIKRTLPELCESPAFLANKALFPAASSEEECLPQDSV